MRLQSYFKFYSKMIIQVTVTDQTNKNIIYHSKILYVFTPKYLKCLNK